VTLETYSYKVDQGAMDHKNVLAERMLSHSYGSPVVDSVSVDCMPFGEAVADELILEEILRRYSDAWKTLANR
jgi:hypothetical protein